jgi:hypothetical protein
MSVASWVTEEQVVGSGMLNPFIYTVKRVPKMFAKMFLGWIRK